jgi:hypothetical protein
MEESKVEVEQILEGKMPTSVNNSCCLRKKQCMLHGKTGF